MQYLKEKKQFYVQDLGSVHGTYLKVATDRSQLIRKGQHYQIGTDIYINIIDVQVPRYSNDVCVDTYDDFMTYIAREYASQTKIYGIEKTEFAKYMINKNN